MVQVICCSRTAQLIETAPDRSGYGSALYQCQTCEVEYMVTSVPAYEEEEALRG